MRFGGAVVAAGDLQPQDQSVPVRAGEVSGHQVPDTQPALLRPLALHRFAPAQGGGEGDDRAAALILWVKPGGGRDGVRQAVPVQIGIFILQHHLVLLNLHL